MDPANALDLLVAFNTIEECILTVNLIDDLYGIRPKDKTVTGKPPGSLPVPPTRTSRLCRAAWDHVARDRGFVASPLLLPLGPAEEPRADWHLACVVSWLFIWNANGEVLVIPQPHACKRACPS